MLIGCQCTIIVLGLIRSTFGHRKAQAYFQSNQIVERSNHFLNYIIKEDKEIQQSIFFLLSRRGKMDRTSKMDKTSKMSCTSKISKTSKMRKISKMSKNFKMNDTSKICLDL